MFEIDSIIRSVSDTPRSIAANVKKVIETISDTDESRQYIKLLGDNDITIAIAKVALDVSRSMYDTEEDDSGMKWAIVNQLVRSSNLEVAKYAIMEMSKVINYPTHIMSAIASSLERPALFETFLYFFEKVSSALNLMFYISVLDKKVANGLNVTMLSAVILALSKKRRSYEAFKLLQKIYETDQDPHIKRYALKAITDMDQNVAILYAFFSQKTKAGESRIIGYIVQNEYSCCAYGLWVIEYHAKNQKRVLKQKIDNTETGELSPSWKLLVREILASQFMMPFFFYGESISAIDTTSMIALGGRVSFNEIKARPVVIFRHGESYIGYLSSDMNPLDGNFVHLHGATQGQVVKFIRELNKTSN